MERTWKPTTAGIMTIITGSWGIFIGVLVIVTSGFIRAIGVMDWSQWMQEIPTEWLPGTVDIPEMMGQIMGDVAMWIMIAGIIVLVFGIIALVGGISAIRRRRWGLSLAGSILSLPLLPMGPILGLLAIIFVSLGKGEFE